MLNDAIRARLAELSASSPAVAGAPPGFARPIQKQLRLAPSSLFAASGGAFDLDAAVVQQAASGQHLRLRRQLADLWPAAKSIAVRTPTEPGARAGDGALHPELAAVAAHFPSATLFLDLETCGFAGAPVFLAGVVRRDEDVLIVDQLFARDYTEECALLETLDTIAAGQRVLATFNGKSFDWPMVCDRSIRHRLRPRPATPLRKQQAVGRDTLVHCDLLHHARRRWKHVLPNCKLQTLERLVCRRVRHDDLGGAEVPTAYHRFVRTGDRAAIERILLHNALDLVTLVEVTLRLLKAPAENQAPHTAAS